MRKTMELALHLANLCSLLFFPLPPHFHSLCVYFCSSFHSFLSLACRAKRPVLPYHYSNLSHSFVALAETHLRTDPFFHSTKLHFESALELYESVLVYAISAFPQSHHLIFTSRRSHHEIPQYPLGASPSIDFFGSDILRL